MPSEVFRIGIAEKCFDIWSILKVATSKIRLTRGQFVENKSHHVLDVDLNFYGWDFRNMSWFRFYDDLELGRN